MPGLGGRFISEAKMPFGLVFAPPEEVKPMDEHDLAASGSDDLAAEKDERSSQDESEEERPPPRSKKRPRPPAPPPPDPEHTNVGIFGYDLFDSPSRRVAVCCVCNSEIGAKQHRWHVKMKKGRSSWYTRFSHKYCARSPDFPAELIAPSLRFFESVLAVRPAAEYAHMPLREVRDELANRVLGLSGAASSAG